MALVALLIVALLPTPPLSGHGTPQPTAAPEARPPLAVGSYISAAPVVADLDGNGDLELVVAAAGVHAYDRTGQPLRGWPQVRTGLIASTPTIADLDGDGTAEVIVGSDDDFVYAWHADGTVVAGWPVHTGGDVFSRPAVGDVDGDGMPEVVVGSDDGGIYLLGPQGQVRPGWPVRTDGFVSADPTLVDLDGDGRKDIVIGSWDGSLYALDADGVALPGWPVRLGAPLWAHATVVDLRPVGQGLCLAIAADRLTLLRADGSIMPKWPVQLRSYTVSSVAVAELDGTAGPELVVGGDALWAFDIDGTPLRGWPYVSGAYVWATPTVVDLDGDGLDEVLAGDFGGSLHLVSHIGSAALPGWPVRLPARVVASVTLLQGGSGDTPLVAVPCWDGGVHLIEVQAIGTRTSDRPPLAALPAASRPTLSGVRVQHNAGMPVAVVEAQFGGGPVRQLRLEYVDRLGAIHPSPFLLNGTHYEALVAPMGVRSLQLAIVIEPYVGELQRVPAQGTLVLPCEGRC